jgi:hypothetical protein
MFAGASTRTDPGPEPFPPDTTVSHGALLDAVHAHDAAELTETVTEPPAAGMVCAAGLIVNEQPLPCVTTKDLPAIVSVPSRDVPVCAAAVKFTDPFPEPLAPEVTVSQVALLVAVQEQPLPADTLTEPLPPAAATFCPDDDKEYEQPVPCCTANVCPAAVMVPLRDGPPFAVTVKRTVPLPDPLAPAEMVIHGALLEAVQGQDGVAAIAIEAVVPEGSAAMDVGSIA